MPKISIIFHVLEYSLHLIPLRWELSILNQYDTMQYTVPIKFNTSVIHVTVSLQLLNQLLNNSISTRLWSYMNISGFRIKTLVFGLIDCPLLVTFQKLVTKLSQRESRLPCFEFCLYQSYLVWANCLTLQCP